MNEIRKMDEFTAIDEHGNRFTVVEFQEFIENKTLTGLNPPVKGLKELRLDDGRHVNFISEGVYKIVESNTIIRRE